MKKLLLTLALVCLTAGIAHADDKGTEFKFGGEMLNRWYWDANPFAVNSNGTYENNWLMRNQFHVNAISSDKMQAYIDLLQTSTWGAAQNVPISSGAYTNGGAGTPNTTANGGGGTASIPTLLQVQEAWMWWKVSDNFSVRVGRQSAEYGAGMELSKNEWLAAPFAMDAAMGRLSWDFLDLDLGGGKLADLGATSPISGAGVSSTDTEVDMYGINAGFKNLPDFLKKADVFIIQINSDLGGGGNFVPSAGTVATGSYGLTTYGLHLKGDVSSFDYRVDGAWQSGKEKAGAAANDANFKGSMYDLEVGYTFQEFMKARLSVGYHQDSGADGSSDYAAYQPLFYDRHENGGGYMDIFGWGDLTDIKIGLTLNPSEDTTVGLKAHLLSLTTTGNAGDAPNIGDQATTLNMFNGAFTNANGGAIAVDGTQKSLGTEIDVWATHNYGHGFQMLAQLGYLSLGSYYKPSGGTAPGNPWQLVLQGKYNF